MRVEEVRESKDTPMMVEIVLSLTRAEQINNEVGWHDECQLVKGTGVVALLEEAAKRLDESDCGVDWSRASQLRDLAAEIKRYEAIDALANRYADKAGEVFDRRFEVKKGGEK